MWIAYWSGKLCFWFENDVTYVAGRDSSAHICVEGDPSLSREHCTFRFAARAPEDIANIAPTVVTIHDKSKYGTAVMLPRAGTAGAVAAAATAADEMMQNSVAMLCSDQLANNNNTNTKSLFSQFRDEYDQCKLERGQEWTAPAGTRSFGLKLGKHDALLEFEWVPWVFPVVESAAAASSSAAAAKERLLLAQDAAACGCSLLRAGGGAGITVPLIIDMLSRSATVGVVVPGALVPSPLIFAALCAAKPIVGPHVFTAFRNRAAIKDFPPDLAAPAALPGHVDPSWGALVSHATSAARGYIVGSQRPGHGSPTQSSNHSSGNFLANGNGDGGGSSSLLLLSGGALDGAIQIPREVFLPNPARQELFTGLSFVVVQRQVGMILDAFVSRCRGGRDRVATEPLPEGGGAELAAWLTRQQVAQRVLVVESSNLGLAGGEELPVIFTRHRHEFAAKIPVVEFTDILCSVLHARRLFDTKLVPLSAAGGKSKQSRLLREDADATDDSSTANSTAASTPAQTPAKNLNKSGGAAADSAVAARAGASGAGAGAGGGVRRGRENDTINNKQKVERPLDAQDDLVDDGRVADRNASGSGGGAPAADKNNNSMTMTRKGTAQQSLINMDMLDSVPAMVKQEDSRVSNRVADDEDDDAAAVMRVRQQQQMQQQAQWQQRRRVEQNNISGSNSNRNEDGEEGDGGHQEFVLDASIPVMLSQYLGRNVHNGLDDDAAADAKNKKKRDPADDDIFAEAAAKMGTAKKTKNADGTETFSVAIKKEALAAHVKHENSSSESDADDSAAAAGDDDDHGAAALGRAGGGGAEVVGGADGTYANRGRILFDAGVIKRTVHLPNIPCFWRRPDDGAGESKPGGSKNFKKFRKQRVLMSGDGFEQMEAGSGGPLQRLDPLATTGGGRIMTGRAALPNLDDDDIVPDDPREHRPRTFALFDNAVDEALGGGGGATRRAKPRGGAAVADGAAAAAPAAKKTAAAKAAPKSRAKKAKGGRSASSSSSSSDDDGSSSTSSSSDDDGGADDAASAPRAPAKPAGKKKAPAKRATNKAADAAASQAPAKPAKPTSIFDVDNLYD